MYLFILRLGAPGRQFILLPIQIMSILIIGHGLILRSQSLRSIVVDVMRATERCFAIMSRKYYSHKNHWMRLAWDRKEWRDNEEAFTQQWVQTGEMMMMKIKRLAPIMRSTIGGVLSQKK